MTASAFRPDLAGWRMDVMKHRVVREFPDEHTERAWRRLLDCAPLASHFVTPEWFLEPHPPTHQPFAILAEEGDRFSGVVTGYIRPRETSSGRRHRPQTLFLPEADRVQTEDALCRGILNLSRRSRLITIYSWEPLSRFAAHGFTPTPVGGETLLASLEGSEDEVFKALNKTRRAGVRKAASLGVVISDKVEEGDFEALIGAFDETHRRLGLPLRSRAEVSHLLRLTRNRKVFTARVEGKIIAATFVRFERGGLAEYSENVSFQAARSSHPNEALLWAAMAWSRSEAKCRAFSFGGANLFKTGFGGRHTAIYGSQRDQTLFGLHEKRERVMFSARGVADRLLRRGGELTPLGRALERAGIRVKTRRGAAHNDRTAS